MLRQCNRLLLLLLLPLWCMLALANTSLNEDEFDLSERAWLSSHRELVIGMPMMGDPPYSYKDADQRFTGPVPDIAQQIARKLGLTLRYKVYPSYANALTGLDYGEVDMLVNYQPGEQWRANIVSIPFLLAMPRGVLLNNGKTVLSQKDSQTLRWVCVTGVNACSELKKLGLPRVAEAESPSEAAFMLKQHLADAYLADMPSLVMLQGQHTGAGFTIATPDWVSATSLSINMSKSNPALVGLITKAFNNIPVEDRRHMLEATRTSQHASTGEVKSVQFTGEEQQWLSQHPVLTYGVSPNWTSMSEFNYRGQLVGFVADLMVLMQQFSGLEFSLVRTHNWSETQNLLKIQQIDFIPAIAPTPERSQFALFTPGYLFVDRVVIGPKGSTTLSNISLLKGKRVGMVLGSVDKTMLLEIGAKVVDVNSDGRLLELLDHGDADYVMLPTLSINSQVSEHYEITYTGKDLRLPLAMATRQDPMLQRILTKVLYSIPPEELNKLEKRWLSTSVQTGINAETVLLWFAIVGAAAALLFALFWAWNRALQQEIVQRQRAEKKLNEQLAFVQTLLDSLPNMVALRDRQQNLTLCNRAYRKLFIGDASEGNGWGYMTEDERQQMLREERAVWETGEIFEGSGYTQRENEVPLHVVYVKLPYRAPDGSIQGVLTVLTDVSALKAAQNKVREVEARLRDITDSMPGVVYQYLWQGAGKGLFRYLSQGASDILGMPQDSLMESTSGGAIFGLNEEALALFVDEVAAHARTLEPLELEVKVPSRLGERYLQVRGNFVAQEGDDRLINGVVQDITTLKQQEHALREARAAAELAMQARSRFLATMSHELRTPISGMHGMLELLRMSELNDDQRYLLRNVESSANNLLYLVNDILDFSKIEAGQLHLNYQSCRLQSVICDVIRGHATRAYSKGLKVTILWEEALPDLADIDPVRVGQVVSNLLNNAVKFTEQGSISIQASYHDQQLLIAVTDTGIGIAKEKLPLLFTPFEQVESDISRRFGGTGLGLTICDQLVRKMGGSLMVSSQAGEGSCFRFAIPLTHCQWEPPALAGSEWWWLGEDASVQSIMKRQGATLTPLDVSQITEQLSGLLLAEESVLEAALGNEWHTLLQSGPLKGVVLSPREALRGRIGSENWWRLGQSPLYPDLLLESCRELITGRAITINATSIEKLGGRVLVADDHLVNRALLTRQLAILGVECEVVEDGEKALRAWQTGDFALLLTDCHMPVMDGYTLTRRLRELGEQAPIISVTADTSEDAAANMTAAGMNDMLCKPYSLDSLRQMLLRWLPAATASKLPLPELSINSDMVARWQDLFGDETIAKSMAREYLASNHKDCRAMMSALSSGDSQEMVEIAHRIKGAARMIGEQQLAEQAAQLESAARLKQLSEFELLTQGVEEQMNNIERDMGLWLDE
ncbi:ATP-binding protein [Aeromonas allosaccharophila]|uniref:ATP-binding protein n=1 Tax=Aeromonas allosaccharophila TaxID=656 RepID=UPI0011171EA0|nr:transporter substrate-binding domain-containing protein [Aeromonas allosaccharophila]TNI90753.1 histidine kinase [Aeromonas allosaccharophila]